jgi:serine phosphatase RsbU (regulator of sigma subunit)
VELYPLVLVVFAVRKRLDAPRWAVAIFVFVAKMLEASVSVLRQGSRFTHWTMADTIDAPLFSLAGSSLNAASLASAGLFLAIVYAVFCYLREAIERQQTIEQELKNARAVQQVLLPNETPSLPSFRIASVYMPAGEVGGDFFQIVSTPAGGALAVIGDVSGKGMPAAMTVSLLVGTFRTLAHYTQSPGEILAAMNQRMLGRSSGGFTTALVVRVDPDGTFTAANAGHLAPYCEGTELSIEGGLPLGLAAGGDYPEMRLLLPAGARLTLLTDGVVEARNAAGELFGFDQTRKLSGRPAEDIAQAAQAFGQEDDITVLTLSFAPAEVAHA